MKLSRFRPPDPEWTAMDAMITEFTVVVILDHKKYFFRCFTRIFIRYSDRKKLSPPGVDAREGDT